MRPYTEVDTPNNHTSLTLKRSARGTAELTAELTDLVSSSTYLAGVVIESNVFIDGAAFIGGHTTEPRDDYATLTVRLRSDRSVRQATRLLIPEERLEEIATAYTLPERLKTPTNYVDAFIGSVIKDLTGYSEDTTSSFIEQTQASTTAVLASINLTAPQTTAIKYLGEFAMPDAQKNALYRAHQVETMEHVLRFLVARENVDPRLKVNVAAGVDYTTGIHLLGEALAIVTGENRFNSNYDPSTGSLLYRGMLAQKSMVSIKDGVVLSTGAHAPTPIWPPEAVEAHEAEKRAAEEALQDKRTQQRIQREAADGQRHLEADLHALATQQEISNVIAQGFTWKGIMPLNPDGPLDSLESVKQFYVQQYGYNEADIHIIPDTLVYGDGTGIRHVPGNVTVYIRHKQ